MGKILFSDLQILIDRSEVKQIIDQFPHVINSPYGENLSTREKEKLLGENFTSICDPESDNQLIFDVMATPRDRPFLENFLALLWANFDQMGTSEFLATREKILYRYLFQILNQMADTNYSGPDVIVYILQVLRALIPSDHMSVFINSEATKLEGLASVGVTGIQAKQSQKPWSIGADTIAGVVYFSKKAYFCLDPKNDPLYKVNPQVQIPRNLFVFPLVYGEQILGVLNMSNYWGSDLSSWERELVGNFLILISHQIRQMKNQKILQEGEEVSQRLGHYVSSNLANNIQEQGAQNLGMASKKKVVALFADIRSFTSISEKLNPKNLVRLLNIYFNEVTAVIEEHHGTIDKLVGDMVAVLWNVPNDVPNAEFYAVRTAIAMQKAMILNVVKHWNASGIPRVGIGIGLSSGYAFVGNVGSKSLQNFTALGPTIDNAQTLESMARPGEILIPEAMLKSLKGKIPRPNRTLRNVSLKGLGEKNNVGVLKPIEYPDY